MSFWKPGTTQAPSSKKQEGGEVKNSQHDNKVVRNGRDTADKDVKTTLSKGVMTMKFMKRKADADLESINIAEKRRKQLDSAWISEGKVDYIQNTTAYSCPFMKLSTLLENNQAAKEEELHLVCTKEDHDLVSSLPGI